MKKNLSITKLTSDGKVNIIYPLQCPINDLFGSSMPYCLILIKFREK